MTGSRAWPSRRAALAADVPELSGQLTAARTETAERFAGDVTAELSRARDAARPGHGRGDAAA